MKRAFLGAVVAALAACAAVAPEAPPEAPPAAALRLVQITFEPPLPEPGELFVEHECGLRLHVRTGRSGVDLHLPPGPASLRLVAGGREWQQPIMVGPLGPTRLAWPASGTSRR